LLGFPEISVAGSGVLYGVIESLPQGLCFVEVGTRDSPQNIRGITDGCRMEIVDGEGISVSTG
jgi:hypothetical protein